MRSKYFMHCRISEKKFRKILRHFCIDIDALRTSGVCAKYDQHGTAALTKIMLYYRLKKCNFRYNYREKKYVSTCQKL